MERCGRVFIRYVYSGYTEQLTERVLKLNVHTTYRVALTLGTELTHRLRLVRNCGGGREHLIVSLRKM